jgi:hypothetical protein
MRTSRRTKPRSEFVFSQGSCSGSLSFRPYGAAGSWWAVDPGRVASLCPGLLSRSPYRRIGLVPMTEAAGGSCFPRSQKRDLAHPVSVADWREAQLAAPQVLGHGFAAHRLEAQLV